MKGANNFAVDGINKWNSNWMTVCMCVCLSVGVWERKWNEVVQPNAKPRGVQVTHTISLSLTHTHTRTHAHGCTRTPTPPYTLQDIININPFAGVCVSVCVQKPTVDAWRIWHDDLSTALTIHTDPVYQLTLNTHKELRFTNKHFSVHEYTVGRYTSEFNWIESILSFSVLFSSHHSATS